MYKLYDLNYDSVIYQ